MSETLRNAGSTSGRWGRLSLLAAAVSLAACTSLAPPHTRPDAPVAGAFPVPAVASPGQTGLAVTSPTATQPPAWADYLADPALRSLVERSLRNNRDLRVAVIQIDTARAALQARQADRLPSVGVGVGASRAPGPTGSLVNTFTAGLQLGTFELDLFGRVRSLSDAAAAQLLATESARQAVQGALVASVVQQALALTAGDELIALTRETLRTREESLRLTRLKTDNGAASDLELRQAQSLVESARATLAQQVRQRALDRNALELLVGEPLGDAPVVPTGLSGVSLAALPAGLPSQVLLQRPDVLQAEQTLAAAQANIGAARAAFFPRISLTASGGFASTELGGLFDGTASSLAANLLQPIFDAGRNRANLAIAQGQRDIAVAQYERTVQAAFRDVADALAGSATLAEQLRATEAQAEAEAARLRLADLRFNSGVASSLDQLDAQRSLFAVQQAVVQTRLALLQNRVATYRALGGGSQASPVDTR